MNWLDKLTKELGEVLEVPPKDFYTIEEISRTCGHGDKAIRKVLEVKVKSGKARKVKVRVLSSGGKKSIATFYGPP